MSGYDLIDERYFDALGSERVVPKTTREFFVLLIDASTTGTFAPATRVIRIGQVLTIDVTLPASSWEHDVRWTVTLDDGQEQTGTLALREAPVVRVDHGADMTRDTRRLSFDFALPLGTHRVGLDVEPFGTAHVDVIVVPERTFAADDERTWGLAVQTYTLRSRRNWGIGDFADLEEICVLAGAAGASLVGINPLHAAHRNDPESASPYSPTSRHFLNWLAIAIDRIPEAQSAFVRGYIASIEAELAELRANPLVDYTGVARVKAVAIEHCFRELSGARRTAFDAFVAAGGERLQRFATYEAIVAQFGRDPAQWPPNFEVADHADVAAFAQTQAHAIAIGMYIQFVAAEQLANVAAHAAACGVRLYRDLAVGVEANSADVWLEGEHVRGVSVGAPPDLLNVRGQNWGLPPLSPSRMARNAYANFASILEDNMRDAGALRIDHAMSLMRLFWIPSGATPSEGAYVRYAFDDLCGILARESRRAACTVIGEDLGTVPEGFRERMLEIGVLSYRILLFELDSEGEYLPPERYPQNALAATGTHDLAPLLGWLRCADIDIRTHLGYTREDGAYERSERAVERARLVRALRASGNLDDADDDESIVMAAYRFLSQTPARIVMVQIEDALGETTPVNVPGTDREYLNWRRKLWCDLENIAADGRVANLFAAVAELRPRSLEGQA